MDVIIITLDHSMVFFTFSSQFRSTSLYIELAVRRQVTDRVYGFDPVSSIWDLLLPKKNSDAWKFVMDFSSSSSGTYILQSNFSKDTIIGSVSVPVPGSCSSIYLDFLNFRFTLIFETKLTVWYCIPLFLFSHRYNAKPTK